MERIKIKNPQYEIEIIPDDFLSDSSDSIHGFTTKNNEVENDDPTSSLKITCRTKESKTNCSISEHSAFILNDSLFLAVGNDVCKIKLPDLELTWRTKSDTALCFGLYPLLEQDCIIVHGECEITRLKFTGEIEWIVSGKDVFTGVFRISATQIEVSDFNDAKYLIDISSGRITLLKGS